MTRLERRFFMQVVTLLALGTVLVVAVLWEPWRCGWDVQQRVRAPDGGQDAVIALHNCGAMMGYRTLGVFVAPHEQRPELGATAEPVLTLDISRRGEMAAAEAVRVQWDARDRLTLAPARWASIGEHQSRKQGIIVVLDTVARSGT